MKNKIIFSLFNCDNDCRFGVDFSDSSLKLLQIEEGRNGYIVKGHSRRKIPKGIIEHGKIIKKTDFIEIFKEASKNVEGNFKGKSIMITIPEEKVFTRIISIPFNEDKKDLKETIKWEIESNLPVSLEDIYYDWQILNETKEKMDVLVMASDREIVNNYLNVFDKLNLKVVVLEPESLSISRSLISKKSKEFNLLIDIGENSSNFVVCRNRLPIFTSNSNVSGKMMTETIIKSKGFNFEKANRYKIKKGLEGEEEKASKEKILDSVLRSLLKEIKETVDFFQENLFRKERNKKIKKIILCGGGSNLKGLDSYLTVKLKQSVVQSNPWINFNFVDEIPPISKQDSQSLASLIGLTLKFDEDEKNN